MKVLWLDTETVGLNGPLMRIQYALDDGPIKFIDYPFGLNCWDLQAELKSYLYDLDVILAGYNLGFDAYHLYRWLHEYDEELRLDSPERPVKPFMCKSLDLQIPAMLYGPFKAHAFSKGKARSVARVRRIPAKAVDVVRSKVIERLKAHVSSEFNILTGLHEVPGKPDLKTLSFSVDGRATLKAHARFYGAPTLSLPDFWPIPEGEVTKKGVRGWGKPWLPYYNELAYEPYKQECLKVLNAPEPHPFHTYCRLDIVFLKLLAVKLLEATNKQTVDQLIDHHSDCVADVAYTRYHGFELDREVLERTKNYYEKIVNKAQASLAGIDLKSSKQRLELLRSVDPLVGSSRKAVLELLARSDRPSAPIAGDMLRFGAYRQRLLQVEKCLESKTGRAHPDLRVMGTATGRMAGTSGFNWQGIAQAQKNEEGKPVGIRAAMKCGMGGDFEALEVTIAAAAYNDKQLQADLDAGIDIHSMMASMLPKAVNDKISYEMIRDGHKAHDPLMTNLRKAAKTVVFGILYGAQRVKIAETVGCGEIEADKLLERFFGRYKQIGEFRRAQERKFQTCDTEHWTKESASRMGAEVTDPLGFTRRFDFEKAVATELWKLGSEGIKTGLSGTFVRTVEKGPQPADQAVRSALLGSAIAIQAAVCRQACNSPIQSTGANLCKILMARMWNAFRMPLLGIHDEAISPVELTSECTDLVKSFLQEFRSVVKSLNIQMVKMNVWADK